jgi:hypothetical protein
MLKSLKRYPPSHCLPFISFILPSEEKARLQAISEYCDSGRTREEIYMLAGETSRDVTELRRDVHCFRAILSEQDFESVGGASGREGLRLTIPNSEKYPLPCNIGPFLDAARPGFACGIGKGFGRLVEISLVTPFEAGGIAHGVESSWAAIVSSILASPPKLR